MFLLSFLRPSPSSSCPCLVGVPQLPSFTVSLFHRLRCPPTPYSQLRDHLHARGYLRFPWPQLALELQISCSNSVGCKQIYLPHRCSSIWAALSAVPRAGGLKPQASVPLHSGGWSPRSEGQRGWFLVRPSPSRITLGVKASAYDFRGTQFSP